MKRFNLSEWAIGHRSLVAYLMLVLLVAGVASYLRLGRSEDPEFTIKTMVVQATWPGVTVVDTLQQITDRLERKLQETPNLDYLKSYTTAGEATSAQYFGFLHGAWFEGRDAGERIAELLGGKCANADPADDCGDRKYYERLYGSSPLADYSVFDGWDVSSFYSSY